MKKQWKRLMAQLLVLMLCLAVLPGAALAEGNDVAQIGETTYTTLDAAVTAAADGDTITVLADCETDGLNLRKDLTIKGAEGVNPTITFNTYGIALWGKALTFEDCTVQMNNITSTPYTGEWNWMAICASTNASLTLNNVTMNIIADSTTTNNAHCIYFCSNNKLNLNKSTLVIKNYKQDALEWDGGDGGYNINIVDSTFISDHNRSGFTGTFYATITNSNVQVINSLGNGSNGSHFIITDSTVDFSNNTSHGLSTGILTVTNSTITANNNGLTGIIFNNKATFVNSDVTITGTKGTSYWNAGMRALNSNASCTIDKNCTFRITDNYVTGIFLDANTSLTIAEGADVVVTGNEAMQTNCSTSKDLAKCGGGITVRSGATATLSSTTQIYNNHAALAGDDIYLEGDTSNITFYDTNAAWQLDGTYLNGNMHCEHMIDGWYNDGYTNGESSSRWEADSEEETSNYISLYSVETSAMASGILALKAAHGVDAVDYKDSKTSYPGIEKKIIVNDKEVDETSINAGDTVTFQLTSNVPDDLTNYLKPDDVEDPGIMTSALDDEENSGTYGLIFHDVMDSALSLNEDSITVTINGTTLSTELYEVITTTKDGCTFEVKMDLIKIYNVVDDDGKRVYFDEDDFGTAPIVVTYTATASTTLEPGTYKNTAWVEYEDGDSEKDTVIVDTYGINIFKYDQSTDEGLSGATFGLYTDSACEMPVFIDKDNNEVIFTSGIDGYVTINGLKEGTYYIRELSAPDGYVKSDTVLTVKIKGDVKVETHLAYVQFANAPIPSTGGAGTVMYTVVGACIILAAGLLFIVTRKKHSAE